MSDAPRPDRPPQVTLGGGFAILASALLVATAFDAMSRLRSVDTRADLVKALDSAAGRGLGVTVEQATDVLHALLLVSGAGAAVTTVLAIFAMLGHAAARTTMTVLAVVVLLCSLAADVHSQFLVPFLGALLAFAVGMLWTAPARAWFRGEAFAPAPPSGPVSDPPEDRTVLSGTEPPPDTAQPPPTYGYGSPPGQQPPPGPPPQPTQGGGWYPPPYGSPSPAQYPSQYPSQQPSPYASRQQYPSHPPTQTHSPTAVPGQVRTAAVVTWVFAGLAMFGFVAAGIALLVARNDLLDELEKHQEYQDLDITRSELTGVLWIVVVVFVLWALFACMLAALVWRGHNWARIVLAISAGLTAAFCLASLPASVPHLVASAVVIGLLFSPSANHWFRGRSGTGRPGPPPPPYAGPSGPPSQPPPAGTYPGPPPGTDPPEGKPPVW